ncbi:MAG: hypothetical protein JXQ75_19725, partial [Phycisphaerae bacterium]|nr:hypothetical protein [Phycisphaerae bacterium]
HSLQSLTINHNPRQFTALGATGSLPASVYVPCATGEIARAGEPLVAPIIGCRRNRMPPEVSRVHVGGVVPDYLARFRSVG